MRVTLGDLEGPTAEVDPKGTVNARSRPWCIEWGVGADDRWHVASREAAVRQQLLDGAPVPVTAMRLRGGDVVQRVAAVREGAARSLVIEIENRTPVAVAVAVAVRARAGCTIPGIATRGSSIRIGGESVLAASREPGGSLAVPVADPWPAVSEQPSAGDREAAAPDGRSSAALVFPLGHRSTLAITVPLSGDPTGRVSASQVAAGWRAVVERAATVMLPGLDGDRWRGGVAALVVRAGDPDPRAAARAARLLDMVGLPDDGDRARTTVLAAAEADQLAGADAVAALRALASRRIRAKRPSGLDELAGPLVRAAGSVLDAATLSELVAALEIEAPRAAADARRLEVAEEGRGPGVEAAPGWSDAVSGGGAEQDLVEMISAAVDELPVGPVLAAGARPGWIGAPIDVRALVTRHGVTSFSVRWHGDRPALLWEIDGADDVVVTTGLDPSWSSRARRGEALLAAPGDGHTAG